MSKCYEISANDADYHGDPDERYTIDEFIKLTTPNRKGVRLLRKKLNEGQIIDTKGYRGIGVWYFDGTYLYSSIGSYGYFLPSVAWKQVEHYGLDYFRKLLLGTDLLLIPDGFKVQVLQKGNNTIVEEEIVAKELAITIMEDLSDENKKNFRINGQLYEDTFLNELY